MKKGILFVVAILSFVFCFGGGSLFASTVKNKEKEFLRTFLINETSVPMEYRITSKDHPHIRYEGVLEAMETGKNSPASFREMGERSVITMPNKRNLLLLPGTYQISIRQKGKTEWKHFEETISKKDFKRRVPANETKDREKEIPGEILYWVISE